MKVKDLIKVLQACDPETRVDADVERCDSVRLNIAKKICATQNAEPLKQMEVDGVAIEQGLQGEDETTISCILMLKANVQ